jgi:hypothetical protein
MPAMSEDKKHVNQKDPVRKASGFLRYSGMAMQMLGTILLFTYAGYKLDEWQKNQIPVWTLVLSLTSIAASLYLLIKGLSQTDNR